jgi:SET domain-containing protein
MKKNTKSKLGPMFTVRNSKVHGRGVFARRRIRKGTTIIEYLGDVITNDEADTRYEDKDPRDNHTFLFTVDSKHVIDAGVNGNEARFINHGCDPNCQSTGLKKRIWIEAIRTIRPGEELSYDYQIVRSDDDPKDVDQIFACRCGAENCRGSMLEPVKKPRKAKKKAKVKSKKQAKTKARKSGSRQAAKQYAR